MDEIFTVLNDLDTNEITFYGSLFDSRDAKECNYCYIKSNNNDIENIKPLLRKKLYEFEENRPRLYKKFNGYYDIVLPAKDLQELGFTIVGKNKFLIRNIFRLQMLNLKV